MPDWKHHLHSRLAALRLAPTRELEIVEELSQHLDDRWRDLTAGGASPDEATRLALAEFSEGNLLAERLAALRQAREPAPLPPAGLPLPSRGHFRHVLRRLGRTPVFTLVTVLTLAIGIGFTTAGFSVIRGVLLKPLPYPDPDSLVAVWQTAPGINIKQLELSQADYFTYQEQNRVFSSLGIWRGGNVTVTGKDGPTQRHAAFVTEGTLPTLGIRPALGRTFTAQDMQPGGPEAVLLTHAFWQSKFDGDPTVPGRALVVDGKPHTIIGVMPPDFQGYRETPDLLLPMRFNRAKAYLGSFNFFGMARLRPGVSLTQASADLARLIPVTLRSFPAPPQFTLKMFEEARLAPALIPLHQEVVGDVGKTLWLLMGGFAFVLLIACANVANLLLVRAEGRQQEFAVRQALGASRGRIAGEVLLESLMLGLLGGAAGAGLAWAVLRLLTARAANSLPRLENVSVDPPVLLFAVLLSLAASLAFGLPALKHSGHSLSGALRGGTRSQSQSRERHRTRNLLVVVQTALAAVLLIASGLMVRTFHSLLQVDPGFRTGGVQTFRLFLPAVFVKEPERVLRDFDEIRRQLTEVPGVASAAFANSVPLDGNGWTDLLWAEDHALRAGQLPPPRRFRFVSPGFFPTMNMRLVAGRDFSWTDLYERRPVTIVSENLARELWRDPAIALGKRVRNGLQEDWREIVGVAGDVHHDGADRPAPPTVYWPLLMGRFAGNEPFVSRSVVFAVSTDRAGAESLLHQTRQAVWSMHRNLPLYDVKTMAEAYRASMARRTFALILIGIAGGMALLLGLVGIYGVVSYSVAQRTRELGIRLALGATRGTLQSMVVRQGMALAAVGVVCGLAGAAALSRLLSSLLFKVSPVDPLTYSAVSVLLLAAAAAASYLPARRASALDPIEAVRTE